ncbi:fungal-specific transcription factor domain-containing protein [Xylariaceae sp. FL0016]|nr:fungal-specific transcription factor domain-containing protein [Xylariaceae sp. FL0016]
MAHILFYPHDAGRPLGGPAAVGFNKNIVKANQACYSCRKQKRKCDKALPSCALCTRMARTCDYSEPPPNPTIEDFERLRDRLASLERQLRHETHRSSGQHLSPHSDILSQAPTPRLLPAETLWQSAPSTFDPMLFLDRKLFRGIGLSIPGSVAELPPEILQLIGDAETLQHTLSDYFGDVHPWLPMVSRKRINITYPMWDGGADVAALYLAMGLITSQPQDGYLATDNYLYIACKRFLIQLEGVGAASVQCLQARILVALYEYGQGIYPAAWMTVASCVRFADFVGLPSYRESNTVLGQCATWTEAEERRRTWWAVYVIDKIIAVGSQKRPLCGEPSPNEILPVDDKSWDTADIDSAIQRTVSSPGTETQSPFGRLCQAALLLGKMLRHCQRAEIRKHKGEPANFDEVAKLTETANGLCACVQAHIAASPSTYFSLVAAQSLCYSAVFKVLGLYSADPLNAAIDLQDRRQQAWGSDEDLALQMTTADGVKKTAGLVWDLAMNLLACLATAEEDVPKTTPFVLDAIYSAAATFARLTKDVAIVDPLAESHLETTRKCLQRLSGRWRLGGEYLKLLEQHEMSAMMGQSFQRDRGLAGMSIVVPGMV